VLLNEADKKVTVVVADDQLSLAIGKGGQNARLAHRLTGYSIDLKSQSQVELSSVGGGNLPEIELEELSKELGPRLVERLIKAGKETLQDVLRTSAEELMEIPGIGEKTAGRLLGLAREILEERAARDRSAALAGESGAGPAAELSGAAAEEPLGDASEENLEDAQDEAPEETAAGGPDGVTGGGSAAAGDPEGSSEAKPPSAESIAPEANGEEGEAGA